MVLPSRSDVRGAGSGFISRVSPVQVRPLLLTHPICHTEASVYHGWPEVSCSNLKLLRESPQAYYLRVVAKSAPPASSEALSYGSLLHLWAELGDREFWSRVVVAPDTLVTATGALSAKGKEWAAQLDADKIGLSQADEKKLRAQTQALLSNPEVMEIIDRTVDREFNVRFEWNGHSCRCRMDGRTPDFLFDWKTTSDQYPEFTWWSSVRKYGYHLQSAMYQAAALAAGWPDERMRFIVTSTVWPYENCVRYLPQSVIKRGHDECLRLLDELQTRMEFDHWTRTSAHKTCELFFPPYALKGDL